VGFIRREKRGRDGVYYYYCSYNPENRNVKKTYLGRADDPVALERVNFLEAIRSIPNENVERLRQEVELDEKLNVPWERAFEEVSALADALKTAKEVRKP